MRHVSGRAALTISVAFMLLLLASIPSAHAYDDNIDTNTTQSPTVNPQQLVALMNQLAQQTNDSRGNPLSTNPQFQNLLSQFNSSLASGNTNQTASTLLQMRNLISANGGGSSSLLSSLLQSLQVSGKGVTINPGELSSLIKLGQDGLPTGLGAGNPAQQVGDLTSLAGLLQNINPQFAAQLLNMASNLSLVSGLPFSLPSGLNGLGAPKGLSAPSVPSPKLAGGGSPAADLQQLILPGAIIAAALTLFLMRGRLARLTRGQSLPGALQRADLRVPEYDPTDPKKRIMYYFARGVQVMRGRGVPKTAADTHREFSARCVDRPESSQVVTLSGMYEKARFSGRQVTSVEADTAQEALSTIERVPEAAGS